MYAVYKLSLKRLLEYVIILSFSHPQYQIGLKNALGSVLAKQTTVKQMDFISKKQRYVQHKPVPYIFFIAVVLSITTTTNTFVQFSYLTSSSWELASRGRGWLFFMFKKIQVIARERDKNILESLGFLKLDLC